MNITQTQAKCSRNLSSVQFTNIFNYRISFSFDLKGRYGKYRFICPAGSYSIDFRNSGRETNGKCAKIAQTNYINAKIPVAEETPRNSPLDVYRGSKVDFLTSLEIKCNYFPVIFYRNKKTASHGNRYLQFLAEKQAGTLNGSQNTSRGLQASLATSAIARLFAKKRDQFVAKGLNLGLKKGLANFAKNTDFVILCKSEVFYQCSSIDQKENVEAERLCQRNGLNAENQHKIDVFTLPDQKNEKFKAPKSFVAIAIKEISQICKITSDSEGTQLLAWNQEEIEQKLKSCLKETFKCDSIYFFANYAMCLNYGEAPTQQ